MKRFFGPREKLREHTSDELNGDEVVLHSDYAALAAERDRLKTQLAKSCDEGRGDPEYPVCSRACAAEAERDRLLKVAEAARDGLQRAYCCVDIKEYRAAKQVIFDTLGDLMVAVAALRELGEMEG